MKNCANLLRAAGVGDHFMNHSATNATCLLEAHVDEQLIMQRTGHSSTAVQIQHIGDNSITSNNISAPTSSERYKRCKNSDPTTAFKARVDSDF